MKGLFLALCLFGAAAFASGGCISGSRVASPHSTCCSLAVPANYVLLDTFHDTNGKILELHTPDIATNGGWVRATADKAAIQSNALVKNTGNDPTYLINTTGTYVTITATLDLNLSDQQVNFYFGASSTASFSSGLILITDPATGTWGVHDYILATDLIPQSSTHTFTAGAQTWKLVYSSTSIAFYINDVLIGSYSGAVGNYGGVCGLEFYFPGGGPQTTWSSYSVTSP